MRPSPPVRANAVRTTILIPARDEAFGIAATLQSVLGAKAEGYSVLVVADNCKDATAAIARGFGVAVIERDDLTRNGKGYALAFGVQYLTYDPPEVVIVLDADSCIERDDLARLAQRAYDTGCPVQAAYQFRTRNVASPTLALSQFAFLVKNVVRPLGLQRIGAPCLLAGSGMAFPWQILAKAPLATGHLTEDLSLSVEFALTGHPPLFCPEASVYSEPPMHKAVAQSQRRRWEQGHIETIIRGTPRLLRGAVQQRRWELLWLAVELGVPPLTLIVLAMLLIVGVSVLVFLADSFTLPLLISFIASSMLFTAVLMAWYKFGRSHLPGRILLAVPAYMIWKFPITLNALLNHPLAWTRTPRDHQSKRF